ncbi:MAG: DNA alkylation repair protein [Treponema sp.]|nr:DNA alkylation repair protein [Treponema sp.]
MGIRERLFDQRDSEYREFQSRLVPNIPKDSIIGVRTPGMRKIAKDVFGTDEADEFLKELPHKFYEENMIHFFLVSLIKDFDTCVKELERFLPFIDCWPVCDQSSPKVFKKNHGKLLPLIKKWIKSEHVYTARFGLRMLMNEFLDEDFKDEYLEWAAKNRGEDYYIKMMVAWYFATALAKQYDKAVKYIEEKKLEPWTHNKAIQKAVESYRVTDEHKKYLVSLRVDLKQTD